MEPNNGNLLPLEPEKKAESPMLIKLRQNYLFFALTAMVIGFLLDLCFYSSWDNVSGTAYPVYVAGLLAAITTSLGKLGIPMKRGTLKYYITILLFAISTWRTDSGFLHFYNNLAIFILMAMLLIRQFYEADKWGMGRYILNILLLPFRILSAAGLPFYHFNLFFKASKIQGKGLIPSVFIGAAAAVPLLAVVLTLLSQADMVFGQLVAGWFSWWAVLRGIRHLWYLLFGSLGFYGLIGVFCRGEMTYSPAAVKKREPAAAIVMAAAVLLCYLLFCWIQVVYLFGSGDSPLPAGVSYSEYARQGFFQLLGVVIINLLFVLSCLYFCRDSRLLKGLLIAISGCTFIMIGSACYRMLLYVAAYHLTFLRILVLWFLLLVTPLMGGCVCYILRKEFPLLRFFAAVIMVGYLAFSLARPDQIIAEYNVKQIDNMSADDYQYLLKLSADAYPALLKVPKTQEGAADAWVGEAIRSRADSYSTSIKSFNFSRNRVKKMVAGSIPGVL